MKKFVFALTFSWVFVTVAHAQQYPPETTYGAEFEFTAKRLQKMVWGLNGSEAPAALSFAKRAEKKCIEANNECSLAEHPGKWGTEYKIVFTSGWWFNVSYDPWVVEIQFKPSTLATLRENRALIDNYIFGTGKEEDLIVDKVDGSGHFNFGVNSMFKGNTSDFLRYFVDFANHPELSAGLFRKVNHTNAPALSTLPEDQRLGLLNIVTEVNKGLSLSIKELAQMIHSKVYYASPKQPPNGDDSPHYQALAIYHLVEPKFPDQDRPVGNRAVRSQASAHEFILMAEYFEARVAFLNQLKDAGEPILFLNGTRWEYTNAELKNLFYMHIKEMGQSWYKFKALIPNDIANEPLDRFMEGNVNWGKKSFVRSAEIYAPFVFTSPFVRTKMKLALKDRSAAKNESNVARIRAQLESIAAQYEGDIAAKAFVTRILAELFAQ